MDENPYQPPVAPPDTPLGGPLASAALSWARIPLALTCTLIVVLFVAAGFMGAEEAGIATARSRVMLALALICVDGAVAFGSIAIGLFFRRSGAVRSGLALFAIGAAAQVILALMA